MAGLISGWPYKTFQQTRESDNRVKINNSLLLIGGLPKQNIQFARVEAVPGTGQAICSHVIIQSSTSTDKS